MNNPLGSGVHGRARGGGCAQVPNIKGVERLSVLEIAGQLGRLQQLAEEGHLHQEDLEGMHLARPLVCCRVDKTG